MCDDVSIWCLHMYVCTQAYIYVLSIVPLLDKSIQLDSDVHWVKANPGQTGFYRVNYDMSNWNHFVSLLRSDHMVSCECVRSGAVAFLCVAVCIIRVCLSGTTTAKKAMEYERFGNCLTNARQKIRYVFGQNFTDLVSVDRRYSLLTAFVPGSI